MIVGRDFAWAHMGKTGGDATCALFQCVGDLVIWAHERSDPRKHISFLKAGVSDRDRRLVLNIRRLPALALSYVQHIRRGGLHVPELGMEYPARYEMGPEEASTFRFPDFMLENNLRRWAPGTPWWRRIGRRRELHIDRWLRMEHLREDFIDFVAELRPLSDAEMACIMRTRTKPPADYDHDVGRFFTPAQMRRLYAANPRWTRVERRVYGGLQPGVPD